MPKLINVVIRDVRDRYGHRLARLTQPHDCTEAGILDAARTVTEQMFALYFDASNVESRMCATDANGKVKWAISPNFLHIAEVGTLEASYIWGDLNVHKSLGLTR